MNHKIILMASMLLMVLVLPSVNAQSFPTWIQDMAGWYGDGSIDDAEYTKSLQFLIDEGIIKVPQEIIYKEIEVLKVVQAETQEDSHVELWKVTNQLRSELDVMTREFAGWQSNFHDREILKEMQDMRNNLQQTDMKLGDLEIKFECYVTKSCNGYQSNEAQEIHWEGKYNELYEMYKDMGQRVVDLEKKEIERHDREVRSGEVQQ